MREQYWALKCRHMDSVLLLRDLDGWVAYGSDQDHVIEVHPQVTMQKDRVVVADSDLDAVIAALRAKGRRVTTADPVADAAGHEVEPIYTQPGLIVDEMLDITVATCPHNGYVITGPKSEVIFTALTINDIGRYVRQRGGDLGPTKRLENGQRVRLGLLPSVIPVDALQVIGSVSW
jgi:hypothetical protein